MKLFIAFLFLLIWNLGSTDLPGIYEIQNERAIDTLELKNDGTFMYLSRGDSCWLWEDISGTWVATDDVLTLSHSKRTSSGKMSNNKYQFSIIDGKLRSIKFPYRSESNYYKKIE